MSHPTDDLEAIKNALHRASARIGCPPGDNADADLYRELSHAAELVSRLSTHPKEVAPTVERISEAVWQWAIDAKMVNATTEPYYLTNDLRARLKTLFP